MATRAEAPSLSIHAARDTALACAIALAVALGIGRFAFTPLLPLMLKSGALTIREGGWLASSNYAGYLVGALSCAAIRLAHHRMVRYGLASTVALMLAMGLVHQFWAWVVIRFIAGAVSACTFVFASQWGLKRLSELNAHRWSGVIYTGPGLGIVATGLLGAAAASAQVSAPTVWVGFALCAALASALVGKAFSAVSPSVPHAQAAVNPVRQATASAMTVRADAAWLILLYGLAGFGYIITATFLPVIARQALPGSPWPDLFWPIFGMALIVGALLASRCPLSWDNRLLLAGSYLIQGLGILLGIVFPTALGLGVGSLLLGLPFTAITLFGMREARRLHGDAAAGLMGYATGSYGLGQIVGPLVAAPIAAHTGSFAMALWIAIAALGVGALALAVLGSRRREEGR
ncbi:YbfB/YjiJ family MFS transporter [Robbsia sp. KACC 23696]|uniref:YbfB/YjiJ family MFS transporter n=1 Tax=Robbsia sp. KACC 23696 TaxID=3149231 RepID=UPI00325BD64B